MARTNATDVKLIMDNCTLSDAIVNEFINAATEVVDRVFVDDTVLTSTQLIEIEKWLTAHLIASTVHRTTDTEKIGDASVKYTGQWGKGLDLTPYGQMVKILDVTGKIATAGKRVARITAIKSFDDE